MLCMCMRMSSAHIYSKKALWEYIHQQIQRIIYNFSDLTSKRLQETKKRNRNMMLRFLRSKSRSVVGKNVRGLAMLVEGRPLEWEESIEHLEYVRKHGIHQFVNTWNRVKSLSNEKLLWGEETEMSILHMSPDTMEVKLSLRGAEVRDQLNEAEDSFLENGGNVTEAATYVFLCSC